MKLRKTKLLASAILFSAAMSVVGCQKPAPDPVNPPVPDPVNAIVLPQGRAIYVGGDPKALSSRFYLPLNEDGLVFNEESWKYTGSGDMLWLELNATRPASDAKPNLAVGTYNPIDPASAVPGTFTFSTGVRNADGAIDGSYFAKVVDGVETADLIVSGSIRITQNGTRYKVIVEVKSASGKELVYKYENDMKFIVFGVPVPPAPFDGTFTSSDLKYYGDFYKVKYGNCLLELKAFPDNKHEVDGYILGLDINSALVKSQKEIKVVPGTYTIDYSQTYNTPMTFNPGQVQGEYIFGSFWVEFDSQGGFVTATVDAGEFTISDLGGGKFKVDATVELADGTSRQGVFEGNVNVIDGTCFSRMEGDIVLNQFTQGVMVYRGLMEYNTNNAHNWAVMIATDGIDLEKIEGTGQALFLDINTPMGDTTKLPEGTFSVIQEFKQSALKPFTYIPGYFDEMRQELKGSWYRDNLEYTAPAVNGTITISVADGGGYVIEYSLMDDYHYVNGGFGNKIDGKYSGKLMYIDATASMQGVPPFAPAAISGGIRPAGAARSSAAAGFNNTQRVLRTVSSHR